MDIDWITGLATWYRALPADMQFLFALPFLVAAGAFAGDWVRALLRAHCK